MTNDTSKFNSVLARAYDAQAIDSTRDEDGIFSSVWFLEHGHRKAIRVDYAHSSPYQIELAHETIRRSA